MKRCSDGFHCGTEVKQRQLQHPFTLEMNLTYPDQID